MKVAVIGSRSFTDRNLLFAELDKLQDIQLIVSGGAKGADKLAEAYSVERGIELKVFTPDWTKYGNAAGIVRNNDIVTEAEMVVAFWDSKSKGTKIGITLFMGNARKTQSNQESYNQYFQTFQSSLNENVRSTNT